MTRFEYSFVLATWWIVYSVKVNFMFTLLSLNSMWYTFSSTSSKSRPKVGQKICLGQMTFKSKPVSTQTKSIFHISWALKTNYFHGSQHLLRNPSSDWRKLKMKKGCGTIYFHMTCDQPKDSWQTIRYGLTCNWKLCHLIHKNSGCERFLSRTKAKPVPYFAKIRGNSF